MRKGDSQPREEGNRPNWFSLEILVVEHRNVDESFAMVKQTVTKIRITLTFNAPGVNNRLVFRCDKLGLCKLA